MVQKKASRLTLIARAYLGLTRDFARDHRLITLNLVATVAIHVVYEIWNRSIQPGEAPMALGILVIAGYAGLLTGAVHAFVQERRKRRGRMNRPQTTRTPKESIPRQSAIKETAEGYSTRVQASINSPGVQSM